MAVFSDDAFNKYLTDPRRGGTLIGNWFEEQGLREATGEGRSVPQRHIPRSGLLTDWTKVPEAGPRKQDNTFERTYGPKAYIKSVPTSKVIGAGEADITGDNPIAHAVQAEGRMARVGPRELACRVARRQAADEEMAEEDAEAERKANERSFETTSGTVYQKLDETLAEKAQFLRKSCKVELLHGPQPDRSIALKNAGMDIQSNVHYSNAEAPTHQRMSLMDPRMRNDMRVSACQGFQTFGKNSEFSKPMGECLLGIAKDDELEKLFQSNNASNPMRVRGGAMPIGSVFAGVPSLTAVKDKMHKRILETWGKYGYINLRHQLYDVSDNEGFVDKANVIPLFRNSLNLDAGQVTDEELDVWLSQLVTMKKTELRVTSLMNSLRPALLQQHKLRVKEVFAAMGPVEGVVKLGAWLSMIQDAELRGVLVNAFGAEEESAVTDVPLTEVTLLELLSDLNPTMDVMALL